MFKIPYRVDEPAAKVDAMLNEHQRRKVEAVDCYRKPHLTWNEYQRCLRLWNKNEQEQIWRSKPPIQNKGFDRS